MSGKFSLTYISRCDQDNAFGLSESLSFKENTVDTLVWVLGPAVI